MAGLGVTPVCRSSKPSALRCPGGEPVLDRAEEEEDRAMQSPKGRAEETSVWVLVASGPVSSPPSASRDKTC